MAQVRIQRQENPGPCSGVTFMKFGGLTLAQAATARLLPGQMSGQMPTPKDSTALPEGKADYTLRIAPVTVELSPERILSTVGYNGVSPGPVLRMREDKPITVDVINDTDVPELVHWHGLLVPAEVDGVEEEATPFVAPQGRRRYQFTPRPAGSRWYHSHAMAYSDLHRGSYTGQFGFLYIDSGNDHGQYDQEIFLALRDWEPFSPATWRILTRRARTIHSSKSPPFSIPIPTASRSTRILTLFNDKSLGAGEPIRVKEGQRSSFTFSMRAPSRTAALHSRATGSRSSHWTAIQSLRPSRSKLSSLARASASTLYVEMGKPGVWILGATEDPIRAAGLGVVVEYASQHRQPQWLKPSTLRVGLYGLWRR